MTNLRKSNQVSLKHWGNIIATNLLSSQYLSNMHETNVVPNKVGPIIGLGVDLALAHHYFQANIGFSSEVDSTNLRWKSTMF